ncbi:DUF427-domain-containing protein [Pseudohyphozyma bogoriensis]|nr:DUF427-domain-containing protein [Pseudohyphozyma bogoriensis]
MPKASLNGVTLAESKLTEFVEGNYYFPRDSIKEEYFKPSAAKTTTFCPWKGHAQYYDLDVDGTVVKDAVWYYPETFEKANHIKDYVAFYKNKVEIVD